MRIPWKLGVGILPSAASGKKIISIASFAAKKFGAARAVSKSTRLPHLTLFQGVFPNSAEAFERMQRADFSFLGKRQRITGTSIWAEKILFLDIKKTGELQRAHKLAFELLFPLCLGKSADPHEFLGISAKEKQSYRKTGYPFSLPAFRPHVTLARLRPAKRGVMPQLSKKARQHFPNCCIEFSKICIYAVGPHGSCGKILFEQKL